MAIGGVTDDGTSYLQVGRNDKSFRFCLLDSLKLSKKTRKTSRDSILHLTSRILRFVSNFFNFPFKVKTLISDRENIQIKVKNLAYKV